MMKVLVFGSLNIDYNYSVDHFVQKGETISSNKLEVFSGGKGLNQSVALAKAGAVVYHAGCIGQDGSFLLTQLKEAGVDTSFVKISDSVRTGNAIIQNDKLGDNSIILYGGANQEITTAYVDEVLSAFAPGDYLVVQNEINQMSYLIRKAKEKKMIIVLNPSPLDAKIKDYPLQAIDYFILNEIEAQQLFDLVAGEKSANDNSTDKNAAIGNDILTAIGDDTLATNVDATAVYENLLSCLRQIFPQAKFMLTLGENGSLYSDGTRVVKQESYQVKAVDTTAAGDTFTGFWLAQITNQASVSQAMQVAAKAAAVVVTRKGASVSIPTLEEVKSWECSS